MNLQFPVALPNDRRNKAHPGNRKIAGRFPLFKDAMIC
jgi:hypothetical protein